MHLETYATYEDAHHSCIEKPKIKINIENTRPINTVLIYLVDTLLMIGKIIKP